MDWLLLLVVVTAAAIAGPVVLVIELVLALRRRTRYFVLPLGLGIMAGIAALFFMPVPSFMVFSAAFAIVAGPMGIVFMIVASMDAAERASPTAVRKGFAIIGGTVMVVLVILWLDDPSGGATPLEAKLTALSVGMAEDGTPYRTASITLADGRREQARVAYGALIPPLTETVRVAEYRRRITGRRVYEVTGSSPSSR